MWPFSAFAPTKGMLTTAELKVGERYKTHRSILQHYRQTDIQTVCDP